MNNIIKRINKHTHNLISYILAVMIIVIPFIHSNDLMNGNSTGKTFVFIYFIGVLIILYSFKTVFNIKNKHNNTLSIIDILLLLYGLIITIQIALNIPILVYTLNFLELIGLAILYLIIKSVNKISYSIILVSICISGTAQAIYSMLQLYGIYPSHHNMFNITGGFFNPGPLAGFLAPVMLIAIALYLYKSYFIQKDYTNRWVKYTQTVFYEYLPAITIISILLVLPATKSRASWLAVIIGTVFLFFKKYNVTDIVKKYLNTKLKKTIGIVSLITLTILTIFSTYSLKKDSANGRLLIWKVTANMIKDKPITGFGYNGVESNYMDFQADYFMQNANKKEGLLADNTTYTYNFLLRTTTKYGIFALLIVLCIIVLVFVNTHKTLGVENIYLLSSKAALIGLIVFSLFSYPEEILPIKIVAVICLAIASKYSKQINFNSIGNRISKYTTPIYKTAFVSVLIFGLLYFIPIVKTLNSSYQQWNSAYLTYSFGSYKESINEYQECYNTLKCNGQYLLNYGKALSMAGEHNKAIKVLIQTKDYLSNTIIYTALGDSYKATSKLTLAEEAYKHAALMIPSRFYPKYLLAKLYDGTGQNKKAVIIATELLEKEIKINSTAIKEIKDEMKQILNINN